MSDPYQVPCSQRDRLKKNYPREYGELLELVIGGKVVVVPDNTPGESR